MADLSLPRQTGAVPSVTCPGCGAELVSVTAYGSYVTEQHNHDAPAPEPTPEPAPEPVADTSEEPS